MSTFRFPTKQFRSIPAPAGKSKFGLFFTPAATLPRDLWDWREVNPREVNRKSSVYKAISKTLTDEPERFHERNRGITIVAEDMSFDDKRQEIVLTLNESAQHGVVDGAHTLDAILETQKQPPENGWPASVFIKAVTGLDADQIAEMAGGLNTSQQVDLERFENLKDHFDSLKGVLANQPYADDIAYMMNEVKAVDVREVLYYLAVFDCGPDGYDEKRHPVALFGRKEGIVRRFAGAGQGTVCRRLLPYLDLEGARNSSFTGSDREARPRKGCGSLQGRSGCHGFAANRTRKTSSSSWMRR